MGLRNGAVAILALSMLLWSCLFWSMRFPVVGVLHDDGYYFLGARSLFDGRGYVLPSRPGEPGRPKYPIGFPLLLAAAFATAGQAGESVAYTVVLLSGWALAGAVFLWARRLGRSHVEAAIAAAAVVFACLPRVNRVMSDLPFTALAAILLVRLISKTSTIGSFADGALAAFAFLIRRQGIALLPACLIGRRRTGSMPAVAAGFLAVDLPLEWYTARFPAMVNEGYMTEALGAGWGRITALLDVVLRNLKLLPTLTPQTAAPFFYSGVARTIAPAFVLVAVTVVLWILLLRGVWLLSERQDSLAPVWVFCLLTLAIIVVWPWDVGPRLAMPIVPVTVLALGIGAAGVRGWRFGPALVWAVLLCGDLAMVARAMTSTPDPRPVNLARMFEVIRAQTEPAALIGTEAPEMVYLNTGREGIPVTGGADDWQGAASADPIKYWLPRIGQRPFYLLGSCSDPPDEITTRTRGLTAGGQFSAREIYRTPDCQYWFGALTARAMP
jgi:hypothetical protein